MRTTVALILLLGSAIFYPPTANSQNFYEDLTQDLQKCLDSLMESHAIPGATFSLRFDETHEIRLASGFKNPQKQETMQPETSMFSGSTGKLFFGAVALKLIQEEYLALDDLASEYLTDEWFSTFPNHKDITIRSLLNHTSGLPRHLFQEEFLEDFVENPKIARLPVDCIQSIANKPAVHPVGKGWAYSDTNFVLLGLIVEKVTQKKYYDLIDEFLLTPLKLDHTLAATGRKYNNLAQGHIGGQNPFQLPETVVDENGILVLDPSFEWAGGGFVTNPSDLTKLVKHLQESDFLSEHMKQLMRFPVNLGSGLPYDNGYGLSTFVWSKMEDTRYGHSGFFPGYLTHVEYSAKRQYAISLQVNTDGVFSYMQQFTYQMENVVNKYLDHIDAYNIRQNFKRQELCWNQANIECYMKAYASSEPIQTISRGGVTYDYDNIIGDYKKYFPKERMGQLHFDNIKTRRLADDLYFVTGRFNLKFPNREELVQGWFSVNAKRINGHWYMITDHSS
ncbi:serine hydrolase domain-containing protein [Flagellimonas flava]|uniref:Beta-lactamase n=1 Tax=Flagellimonas flava TaxID=570519 RepID=A0A1M5JYY0_9FLAO|nr:serine hydrolase domain-containing protein [Allomuricauda flava]SHG45718.1 Beta-lactamase [Allomuricauda flava]